MPKKDSKNDDVMVRVKRETRDKLADMGKKSQTFDDIIVELINKAKKK